MVRQSCHQQELAGADGGYDDNFGASVALSADGNTAVVGAPYHSYGTSFDQGEVDVFESGGGAWGQTAHLTDTQENGYFGQSVGIDNSTIVVGAPFVSQNNSQGDVYIFDPAGKSWFQDAYVPANQGHFDDLGSSVAISGATVLGGAIAYNDYQGSVYVLSSEMVQPQGAPLGADTYGNGSLSEKALCSCADQGSSEDPVTFATGDLSESATDLTLPGAGLPLEFSRAYDAQAAQSEIAHGVAPGPLGYGWSDNLGMNISYNTSVSPPTATVTEENGAQTTFIPYADETNQPWCTSATNFCSTAPRVEATLNHNGDGTWTYVRTTGGQTTFTFSSSGSLTSISDPAGDMVSVSAYSPGSGQTACPGGETCEAWTSSASGRQLVLASDSSGQLVSVFDANSTLAASFSYSASGCTWSAGQTPDLCGAIDPGGLTSSYTYDSANPDTTFDYDLLSVARPGESGTTTDQYDNQGRVVQQSDPSGQVTTFSYVGTNSSLIGGSTTVTVYPDGTGSGEPSNMTVYQYSSDVLIAQTVGAASGSQSMTNLTPDPVSLLPVTSVDGDGNQSAATYQTYSQPGGTPVSSGDQLTSTDPLGNTVVYAYNSFNQPWCTVDAADNANGAACPTTAPSSPPAPGATDPYLGVSLSFYNSADQLTATTDPLGDTTVYSYTSGISGVPNGLMYCSVDPVDYQKNVSCPAYGAAHVTGTTTATFDSAGDRLTSTDADGNTTTYVYSASGHPGLVSSSTDPDGTTTNYTYNGAGQVTSQVMSFAIYSATTSYDYDSQGRKFCQVDPYESVKGVTCPSQPPATPPTPSSDPYLGATITTYDNNGRVVQTTNPLGGITYSAYDQSGEKFCTVAPAEAAKGVTCPSASPSSPPTPGNDPYLGATITTYDPDGRVVQVTNPLGGITLNSYDAANNLTETTVESDNSTVAPNVITAYSYDADNRVVSTAVDPSDFDETTLTYYDPNGDVYCTVSANTYSSSGYQCPAWQPGWITSPPSPSTLYSSTPDASQAENVTTSFYNANGDQVQTTNADIDTTVTAIDGDGRTYCSADPTNVAAWLSGHPSGTWPYLCPTSPPTSPPTQGSNPGYTTTIFDPAGRTGSSSDQVGDTTSYTYTPGGQTLTTTDPRGQVTINCYYYQNVSGQCAAGAPSGGGSGDNLYSTTTPATSADPSGEVTTYTYYPGGPSNVTTSPAGTTTDSYDANGDLTTVDYTRTASGYATPANLANTYNVDGTRSSMLDATGTTTYSYDANGDVTSQVLTAVGGTGLSNAATSYSYYDTGVLASVTYPSYSTYSTPQVTYAYDTTGAMVSESDWLANQVTFTHDQDGNTTTQNNAITTSNPSGTSGTAFSYDLADYNTAATSTVAQTCGGTETLAQSFSGTSGSRNPAGQLTQYQTSYSGSCSGQTGTQRDYSYDIAGRVVYQGNTAQGTNPNNIAYDPSGDPTTISSHDSSGNFDTYTQAFDATGETTSQTPNSGSQGTATTYSYDTLGDQTKTTGSTSTSSFGYNQDGRMTAASSPAGTASYLYNGDGLEASSTIGSPTWSAASSVDGTIAINSVSCVSSSFCMAVDADGHALQANHGSSTIDGTNPLNSVSCPTNTFCVAVDNVGNAIAFNGTSWASPVDIDGTDSLKSVSCATASFCVAVDSAGNALVYNNGTWSSASAVDSGKTLEAVSCPNAGFCVAVDGAGNALVYNNGTWSAATAVDSGKTLEAVSCPNPGFCAVVDSSGNVVSYNGSSWSTPQTIDTGHTLRSISCPTIGSCQAVDNVGNQLAYNGTTWTSPADIDGTHQLNSVSCSATGLCDAVDNNGNVNYYQLPTWSAPLNVDGSIVINAISCPTTSLCMGVDANGHALRSNHGSSTIDGTNPLNSVSCPTNTFCVAVDNVGNAVAFNGTSWASPVDIDGTNSLRSVSCATASFCVAVDSAGNALVYNNGTWSAASAIDSGKTLEAVSCPNSGFCVAVDSAGNALVYNNGTWSSASSVDSGKTLEAVSCPIPGFCAVVDSSGSVVYYNGSTWSTPQTIDTGHTLRSVSCPTISSCQAVDNVGNQLAYNGTTWTSPADIDGTHQLNSVSCSPTASSVCDAVDNRGYLNFYNSTTNTTQLTWDANTSPALPLSDGANDYIYGPGGTAVEQITLATSTSTYLTYTPSNSTWISTNQSGDETGFWGYDAYGTLAFGTPTSPFGYSGQYMDATTGLVNDRARWFEPQTGGLTSRDPAFPSTDTAYTYAGDDPVNESDPSGLMLCDPGGQCGSAQFLESLPQPCSGASSNRTYDWALGLAPLQTRAERAVWGYVTVGEPSWLQLEPSIDYWSHTLGVNPYLVATVIAHEGGCFNTWRSEFCQILDQVGGVDIGHVKSLGVAKVRAPTAEAALEEYFPQELATQFSGSDRAGEIQQELVNSGEFSVQIATAVLANLQHGDGRNLSDEETFLAYSVDAGTVVALDNVGWNLDAARSSGSIDATTYNNLVRREGYYQTALSAVESSGFDPNTAGGY